MILLVIRQVVGWVIVFFPILLLYLLGRRYRDRSSVASFYGLRVLLFLTMLWTSVYALMAGMVLAHDGDLPTGHSVALVGVWGVIGGGVGIGVVLAVWFLATGKGTQ